MPEHTRILLIDDDAVDRAGVRRTLAASDLDFGLTEAATGADGLAHARATAFDCVLLDYRLPDVDAFDLLAELISAEGRRQAVIMLTGDTEPETALRLMRAGALDHLAKGGLSAPALARAIRYARARRGFLAELEAAQRELEAKNQALDLLNQQKSLLFSIIAHDLRNPFQALLGLSQTLGEVVATRDQAAVAKRAQGLHQAAQQAHALMEGLFSWADLQMRTTDVALATLPLAPLVAEATGACRQRAADKGLAFEVAVDDAQVRSHGDMLAAILRNLAGNAVKFTAPGGTVRVGFDEGSGRLSVADTGVGMDESKLATLFRPDRRVTSPGTAGEPGSGLGLLLCHDLAERLGSRLEVRSRPGAGTTFSLLLPLAA